MIDTFLFPNKSSQLKLQPIRSENLTRIPIPERFHTSTQHNGGFLPDIYCIFDLATYVGEDEVRSGLRMMILYRIVILQQLANTLSTEKYPSVLNFTTKRCPRSLFPGVFFLLESHFLFLKLEWTSALLHCCTVPPAVAPHPPTNHLWGGSFFDSLIFFKNHYKRAHLHGHHIL